MLGYNKLGFVKPEVETVEVDVGITYLLSQSFPKWLVRLLDMCSATGFKQNPNEEKYEEHPVDILDARERDLKFSETGFTVIKMDKPSQTTNWRSKEDVKKFEKEIGPKILELHPGATRIEFTYSVVRGGKKLGDQPAAVNMAHLDYFQNDQARMDFHEEYPVNETVKEHLALLGKWDTPEEEVKTLVGIWKPINMANPVYDHPLAVMDASTFRAENERAQPVHFDIGLFKLHNLNGAFTHDPGQRWYYYPKQDETEVTVFTHYSKGKHFANPHTSFLDPNRPADGSYDTRQSVEMRAAVFYPRS